MKVLLDKDLTLNNDILRVVASGVAGGVLVMIRWRLLVFLGLEDVHDCETRGVIITEIEEKREAGSAE